MILLYKYSRGEKSWTITISVFKTEDNVGGNVIITDIFNESNCIFSHQKAYFSVTEAISLGGLWSFSNVIAHLMQEK